MGAVDVIAGQKPKRGKTIVYLAVNYASKAWQIGLALICTPIYLSQLGPEGFGAIGLFLTVQRIASLFDTGLSRTINRVMSGSEQDPNATNTLRTLEVIYLTSCAILLAIALSLSTLQDHGKSAGAARLVPLMATAIAVQMPGNFYAAAMVGLERHVALNAIQMIWQGMRFGGGAIIVLCQPSITAFLGWQIATGLVYTCIVCRGAWSAAPGQYWSSSFRWKHFRSVSAYAGGATLCSVTAVLTTQVDKLILWGQLDADAFGYYMLCWSLAATLYVVASPISTVMFPRFSRLSRSPDSSILSNSYHRASQLITVAIAPITATGCLFGAPTLHAWLGDPSVAVHCSEILSLLVLGVGINCLSAVPYTLQLAVGWTRLANQLNVASLLLFGPAVFLACQTGSGWGTAVVWCMFSCTYLCVQVALMHRRFLAGELWQWVRVQLAIVCATTSAVGLTGFIRWPETRSGSLCSVIVAWSMGTLAALLASRACRTYLASRLKLLYFSKLSVISSGREAPACVTSAAPDYNKRP